MSMIKISPFISFSWSKEPPEVREAYKRLSDQLENRLREMRRNNTLIIIHENLSSPPPSPPPPANNGKVDVLYHDYNFYYDYNYYYYEYYNNYYFY
jgi:hypothetical protein